VPTARRNQEIVSELNFRRPICMATI